MQVKGLYKSLIYTVISFLLLNPQAEAQNSLTLELQTHIGSGAVAETYENVIKDREIYSPKSVRFSKAGDKIYINSLEGGNTVVYSWPQLRKLKSIHHRFNEKTEALFQNESSVFDYVYYTEPPDENPNHFIGKPVESELSPDGRWLWVPYYRRDFDTYGQSPGAIAIIDTKTDKIVRVMPTGPIPKYVVASPDGHYVAVVYWGDNTVGIIDTNSDDPLTFQYVSHLVVEEQLSQEGLEETDRDKTCGFCLRGAVFSKDSRYLLVARMGKGGIAGFDVENKKYLGSIMNIKSTPRHLVLSPDKETIYASSNYAGYVSKISTQEVIKTLLTAGGRRIRGPKWQELFVGEGARTIDLSPDGQYLFAAINNSSELVTIHTENMGIISRINIPSYPVGLAVAPDFSAVLLTSQGRSGKGGNAVTVVRVKTETPLP